MALSSEQLGTVIDYANNQVKALVENTDFGNFENDKDTQRLFIAISRLYDELNVAMTDVIPKAIYDSYSKGLKQAEKLLANAGMGAVKVGSDGVQSIVQAPIHVEAITNIVSDTLEDLSAAIRTAKVYSHKELDKTIKELHSEIANGMIAGFTNDQIMKRVGKKFGEKGMTSFITSDGKHLPLDFYAKTVTRTKMQTAYNHGHLNRYKERKVKHVEVVGNIPTCAQCAVYRGLIFATESGDEFPHIDLHKTFPVHPNCKCNFRPWIKKFKRDGEVKQALEKSKTFDPNKDTRTKSEATKYDANQKAKAAARQKRLTFVKLNSQLGKDGPQSFNEFKNASKRQYNDWIAQSKGLTNKNVQKVNNDVILNSEISNERNESIKQPMEENKISELKKYAENEWLENIELEEAKAITDYTLDKIHNQINGYLRGETKDLSTPLLKSIQLIESGINKFNYNDDVVAYRAVTLDEYNYIISNNSTIEFLDFKSTSLEIGVAKDISELDENDDWTYLVEFRIRKQASGAYIAQISQKENEIEYLLNRGQTYRIIDEVYDDKEKFVQLKIEVLGYE
ncbi:ADP-ribosyltransferase [Staphylococcus saprophyticus]|nr:ADP-ribosyltransferase [Staphylococcus saprophyticus]